MLFLKVFDSDFDLDEVAVMSHHAKTFYWASQFFGKSKFQEIALIYSLCRAVDDIADELPIEKSLPLLDKIKLELKNEHSDSNSYWKRVKELIALRKISMEAIFDLIDGAIFDQKPELDFKSTDETIQYSYFVAGTVGVIMCPLIGARDPKAYNFALDLGIAMQITNICRDVKEDFERSRVYLPKLYDSKGSFIASKKEIEHFLVLSENYYTSGLKGSLFIPWKERLPVIMAAFIYRGINNVIRNHNYTIEQQRFFVSKFKKVYLSLLALAYWMLTFVKAKPQSHQRSLHSPLAATNWKSDFLLSSSEGSIS